MKLLKSKRFVESVVETAKSKKAALPVDRKARAKLLKCGKDVSLLKTIQRA